MFKQVFFLLFTLYSCYLHSDQVQPPQVIDYGQYLQNSNILQGVVPLSEAYGLGCYAFNSAPELISFFAKLKRDHKINVAIETGTFIGSTTAALSLLFNQVHTIELEKDTFERALTNLKNFSNVHCHLGSSEQVLDQLLPTLDNQRVLFYLDAHWREYWPLLAELEEIAETHKDHCIIIIDDFKVPSRPEISYDAYGSHECSYEYIQSTLDKVFTDYSYFYLIPKNIHSRAKFVAIPKKWR